MSIVYRLSRFLSSRTIVQNNYRKMLSNNVSARINMIVMGNGAMMQPSLIVTSDKINYLFNCGEGTQRMIIEHNKYLKLGKLQNIFFTGTSYENWSGFFGLVLTVAEIKNQFRFHGSKRFAKIIQMYRQFLQSASKVELQHVITDNVDTVIDLIDDDDFLIRSLSYKESTAYILIAKDKIGRLLIDKCKQLNIPPGPKFAALKNGETIEIDGKIIQPNDVVGPPEPGAAIVILECPQSDYLNDFYQKIENFNPYVKGKQIELVVHMTPAMIANNSNYQNWLKTFDSNVKHLILNENSCYDLGLISSTELQIKLNLLDNEIFRSLSERQSCIATDEKFNFECKKIIENIPNLFTYQIRPRKKFEILDSNCCWLDVKKIHEEILEQQEFKDRLNEYKTLTIKNQQQMSYPNVLFLGTGSSSPGKQRNTSGILVNLNEGKSILLDCGESTILQMIRFFGHDHYRQTLQRINVVFITHYHADHHFGLIKLIKERLKLSDQSKPLWIIAPYSILSFLNYFDQNFENISKGFCGIACETLSFDKITKKLNQNEEKQKLLQQIDLKEMATVLVPHCFESYGIIFETNCGKKFAYSGDSMYSDSFDYIGKNCDMLIHEATMNDDLWQEAEYKRHSTISQAINVGRKIDAKYTVLTHFSQRYAKMAPINLINDELLANYIEKQVVIAFDFMQISFENLANAARLKYPLELLFDEEIQRMQNVVSKRNNKRKLLSEEFS
ncbi:ribonuclease Z, mitochondrial-like [Dermatophagoides pteronyssinus]|uniref:ribonuclease Z, mitochondrial-like n=1 Tax=Dermatophagoides pteronyssinus TaxID=6956 RepID=UPI003F6614BA